MTHPAHPGTREACGTCGGTGKWFDELVMEYGPCPTCATPPQQPREAQSHPPELVRLPSAREVQTAENFADWIAFDIVTLSGTAHANIVNALKSRDAALIEVAAKTLLEGCPTKKAAGYPCAACEGCIARIRALLRTQP